MTKEELKNEIARKEQDLRELQTELESMLVTESEQLANTLRDKEIKIKMNFDFSIDDWMNGIPDLEDRETSMESLLEDLEMHIHELLCGMDIAPGITVENTGIFVDDEKILEVVV